MATRKEDTPNWGGNALGTSGVGVLTENNRDDELRTTKIAKPDTSPEPEYSPGGPKVKDSLKSEPRSSVTG